MWDFIQAEWGFAHFTDPSPKRTDLFGTKPRLMAPGHFEFVDRLSGNSRRQDAVDAAQDVVVTFEPPHTLIDGQPGAFSVNEGAKTGQGWQVSVRLIAGCERALRKKIDGRIHGFPEVPER
jgi:hypothetical protein